MKKTILLVLTVLLFSFQHQNQEKMEKEMPWQYPTFVARHISVSINRPTKSVYDYASKPENLPNWAKGLASTVKKEGDYWLMDSPMGKVKVKFADKNNFGVLDHEVTLPSGEKVYNPVRILSNDKGSEMVFTVFRLPGRTDQDFDDERLF